MLPERFTAIVLAAQRAGEINALAHSFGITHKCLVPVAGQPLIRHVVAALAATPGLHEVRISVEPELVPQVRAAMAGIAVDLIFMPPADNLADSVYGCVQGVTEPVIVTTADNVLLLPESVTAMLRALGDADGAIALAARHSVLTAHPEGQRRFYRFADDHYSNCNLYAIAGPKALTLVEAFRSGGRFKKNPRRLIMTMGLFNLLLLLLGRVSLRGAAKRIGQRFGIRLAAVVLRDGSQAIDVDNARSHSVAEQLLLARAPLTAAA
ncbi:MAG TPA: NTP transferase domain-containing protein [Sphingomonas sp.]|nr:NTP transferase domain-containing protein [Sphingomonas sp.]